MIETTRVLLVYPRFTLPSFWRNWDMCRLLGARSMSPPLGLLTVAAMLPAHWSVRLVDCNIEALEAEDLAWADLVFTSAMLPQRSETQKLIARIKAAGKSVAVGGPDPTSSPEMYAQADFRVLGEAECVIDQFVAAWENGARAGVFDADEAKADVTRTPTPRFDLLKLKSYLYVGVQFSRGCPFTCEFCDIIELYGRVPRTKSAAQVLAELDLLFALGWRGHVDFVDDNLIGNKKAVKAFLPHLIAWQKAHGYPFDFSTEASLNLADDPALLDLLRDAGFFLVFVGIESPNEEVLRSAQKKQNTRRDIAASVHRIYQSGLLVIAGFIVGFDNEAEGAGAAIVELIEAASIPVAALGLLYALPDTQLSRRLDREGRLFPLDTDQATGGDQCLEGLNFRTLRPRAEVLRDYRDAMAKAYAPQAFFARVRRLEHLLAFPSSDGAPIDWRRLRSDLSRLARAMFRATLRHPAAARHLWPIVIRGLCGRFETLGPLMAMALFYVHLGPFSRRVVREMGAQIAQVEEGRWTEPLPNLPAAAAAE